MSERVLPHRERCALRAPRIGAACAWRRVGAALLLAAQSLALVAAGACSETRQPGPAPKEDLGVAAAGAPAREVVPPASPVAEPAPVASEANEGPSTSASGPLRRLGNARGPREAPEKSQPREARLERERPAPPEERDQLSKRGEDDVARSGAVNARLAASGRGEWLRALRLAHEEADDARTPAERAEALASIGRLFEARLPGGVDDPATRALRQDLASRAARLALELGRSAEALDWATRGLGLSSAPTVLRANLLLVRADALEATGQREAARAALVEALAINQQLLDQELENP